MSWPFFVASFVAVVSTLMVVTRRNAVHALLYLVVSFLSVAVLFALLGAPFVAALEVIIYAGAIMVFFVFVVMMFNLGVTRPKKNPWTDLRNWAGPVFLSAIVLGEFLFIIFSRGVHRFGAISVPAKKIGTSLFGPYLLGVELAAMLLLAGVVGASHLAKPGKKTVHRFFEIEARK